MGLPFSLPSKVERFASNFFRRFDGDSSVDPISFVTRIDGADGATGAGTIEGSGSAHASFIESV